MTARQSHRVNLCSIELVPDGQGFVFGLVAADQQVHRMELPSWTVYQLMRALPHLDAALLRARGEAAGELIAYPVVRWGAEPMGTDGAVALSVLSDRRVESSFLLAADDARALHAALGDLIGVTSSATRAADRQPAANEAAAGAGLTAPASRAGVSCQRGSCGPRSPRRGGTTR
jgi:hypothetical protein